MKKVKETLDEAMGISEVRCKELYNIALKLYHYSTTPGQLLKLLVERKDLSIKEKLLLAFRAEKIKNIMTCQERSLKMMHHQLK